LCILIIYLGEVMIVYPMFIKNDGKTIIVWVPDLKKKFVMREDIRANDIQKEAALELLNYLNELKSKNIKIPLPQKIKAHKDKLLDEAGMWAKVYVEFEPKSGCFRHTLPIIGVTSMVASAICASLASFLAILFTANGENSGRTLGILGGVLNLILSVMVYFFSGARGILSTWGGVIDDGFSCKKKYAPLENEDLEGSSQIKRTKKCSTAIIVGKLALSGLAIADTLTSSITVYQELTALGDRNKNNLGFFSGEAIIIMAWIYAIANAISLSTYEISFANAAVNWVTERVESKKEKPILDEESNSDKSIKVPVTRIDEADALLENSSGSSSPYAINKSH
jgi:hypothetical protein